MKKNIMITTALLSVVSCLFAETDPVAMKAIKAMRYGSNAKYNLVSPVVETRITVDSIVEKTAGGGIAIDGVTLKDGGVTGTGTTSSTNASFDVIAEKTAGTGVTVDSVLLKDGTGLFANGAVGTPSVKWASTNGIYYITATQMGLAINGAMVAQWDDAGLVASGLNEMVVGAGVTVDGAIHKDGFQVNGYAALQVTNGMAIAVTRPVMNIYAGEISTCTVAVVDSGLLGAEIIFANTGTTNIVFNDNGATLALGSNQTLNNSDTLKLLVNATNQLWKTGGSDN